MASSTPCQKGALSRSMYASDSDDESVVEQDPPGKDSKITDYIILESDFEDEETELTPSQVQRQAQWLNRFRMMKHV